MEAKKEAISRAELGEEFENELAEFAAFLQMELRRGKNTLESYVHDMREFAYFLKNSEGKSSFKEVDWDSVPNWTAAEFKRVGRATQARRLSALKCLAGFLLDEGVWEKNFCESVSRPKVRRKTPEVLNDSEITALLNAPSETTFEGIRDRAMLELMYGSGLRVSELCSIKYADIDYLEGTMRVRGKGDKTRLVPLGDCAKNAIMKYLPERSKIKSPAPELFITKRSKKLSRKTFWFNIVKYASASGIDKQVKPHMLRHSFATHLLQRGADLMSIRKMLGHADLSTTQIYTTVRNEKLSKEHLGKHPRSRMDIREPE